jgi:hypothetical protein
MQVSGCVQKNAFSCNMFGICGLPRDELQLYCRSGISCQAFLVFCENILQMNWNLLWMLRQIVAFWGKCWVRDYDALHGPADHVSLHGVTVHCSLTPLVKNRMRDCTDSTSWQIECLTVCVDMLCSRSDARASASAWKGVAAETTAPAAVPRRGSRRHYL